MRRISLIVLILLSYLALGCSVTINPTKGLINLKQGSTNIKNNEGLFDFGNHKLGASVSEIFTIENIGKNNLHLLGNDIVDIEGPNADEFIILNGSTLNVIEPQSSTTFFVMFYPKTPGDKKATIVIENSDRDKNPFTFLVVGFCLHPEPEISVKVKDALIPCLTGTFDFGYTPLNGSSKDIDFTIYNTGDADLDINTIVLDGVNASMFILDQSDIQSTIAPGEFTVFSMIFRPTAIGIKIAKINIMNNDSDENPYSFKITGTCTATPEIEVRQNSVLIPSGSGLYSFDAVLINESSPEITFEILNLGSSTLYLNGINNIIQINGIDASMFSVNETATERYILAGNSTTFKLVFSPKVVQPNIAEISISNNDNDENPYTFKIQGNCLFADMKIKQDVTNIPNSTGEYDFGDVVIGYTSLSVTFTIENNGTGDLKLSGTPIIDVQGANSSMFVVDDTSTSTLVFATKSTTFDITFVPTNSGNISATVSIENNDHLKDPYTFTVKGYGISQNPGVAVGWIGGGSNGWKQSSGTSPKENYQGFNSAYSICLDSDENIYVADNANNRISKWDKNGNAIGWIGGGSNGWKTGNSPDYGRDYKSFCNPTGVYVDSSGFIFVVDSSNCRIAKWDKNGNAIGWIGCKKSGWQTSTTYTFGSDYASFITPTGIFVDNKGNIFVTDSGNNRVSKWSAQGNPQGWIGHEYDGWQTTDSGTSSTFKYKGFNFPSELSLDSNGNIYVSDLNNHRICKWSSQGIAQGWIGGGFDGWQKSNGTGVGQSYKHFNSPWGLCVTDTGNIYIGDGYNKRISKWTLSGQAVGWIGGGSNGWKTSVAPSIHGTDYQSFTYIKSIAIYASKYIYSCDPGSYRVCLWID